MRSGRGLALALGLWAGAAGATPPDVITAARFAEPTGRYPHGVLGDDQEWGALVLTVDRCQGCAATRIDEVVIRLPEHRVFEDIAPRIWPIDADDLPKVVVVESDAALGARLAVYDETGFVAATPFIGQRFRWLAPVGVADFDGDGWMEVAYVDRPHLAKTLRLWRYADGEMTEIAALPGISNHRIGEAFITGGLRDCGAGPEIVAASGDWSRVVAVRLEAGALVPETVGPFTGPEAVAAALACE